MLRSTRSTSSLRVREVVASTHILVVDGGLLGLGIERRLGVEPEPQHRLDAAIRARVSREAARARVLDTRVAVLLSQAQDPKTPAKALLGMRSVREDRAAQRARGWTELARLRRMRDGVHAACWR